MKILVSWSNLNQGSSFLSIIVRFIDSVLRGLGQVMLQNNPIAGLIFLFGIFYNSFIFGVAALVGTVVSTITANVLNVDARQVRDGLFGFNGALVAIALSFFLEPNGLTWIYLIFAAASSTILMAAMIHLLKNSKMPTLTAPFVFSSYIFLLACARFGQLHSTSILPTAGLPKAATIEGVVTMTTIVEGVFTGIGQVFFQGNIVTGILFVLGLLISSWRSCMAALMGSTVGILVAWLLGAAEPAIRSGAFSFNPALTAIALGSVFLAPSVASVSYTFFGAVMTTVAFAATSGALEPLGMPALTLPFVVVTWIFLLARSLFPAIKGNPL